MAKFTRTAYASANLRDIARELARRAGVDTDLPLHMGGHDLHQTKGAGRKRVRVTVLVEPEAPPPKRASKPRKPRPVQQPLPLETPPQVVHGPFTPTAEGKEKTFRVRLYGADGAST